MPYKPKQNRDEDGAVLLYALCLGALLVVFSVLLLQTAGQLGRGQSRLPEEEAWQQAATLTDALEKDLISPGTELHGFVGDSFLGETYQDDETYSFTADPAAEGYGTVTLTLTRHRLRMQAEPMCWHPSDYAEEELLTACENYEETAPGVWRLEMTVAAQTQTARARCDRCYIWTEGGQVLYQVGDLLYRRIPGSLDLVQAETASPETAADPPLRIQDLTEPLTASWVPGEASEASCVPEIKEGGEDF